MLWKNRKMLMTRIDLFVNEYVGIAQLSNLNIDQQVEMLTDMIKDLLIEDRLRSINILDISGIKLEDKQKRILLEGL